MGAVRGTVRDALIKFPGLDHDEITALSSELWAPPVFEPRLAAVVLLQSRVPLLRASDLTRLEGFLRDSRVDALTDPLAHDVVRPLRARLDGQARSRAETVLDRWATEGGRLARAAEIVQTLTAVPPPTAILRSKASDGSTRWAIRTTVRSPAARSRSASSASATGASTDAVGSSRISTSKSASRARASASLCA
ncbi:DNA alkylation repair protein [Rathayibacter oskolensis]|nr:DNA alkylation repair protein [Rathayibacter oskolensis]WKK73304.1 DNA alkylation repair protein [Rathayibacter oskolensis]